jgi:hypothetical protein
MTAANPFRDPATAAPPSAVEGTQLTPADHEFNIGWENPPIPAAAGWYWADNYGELSLSGPYNTLQAAYDDAVETLDND